jgi:hypothetical protein
MAHLGLRGGPSVGRPVEEWREDGFLQASAAPGVSSTSSKASMISCASVIWLSVRSGIAR